MTVVAEFKNANEVFVLGSDQDDVISRLPLLERTWRGIGQEFTDPFPCVQGGNIVLEGCRNQVGNKSLLTWSHEPDLCYRPHDSLPLNGDGV